MAFDYRPARPFDWIQHAVVLDRQGSRAISFLQGMACYVEAILGYLDRIMGHHCRSIRHGFSHRPIRIPNVRLSLCLQSKADMSAPISLVFCPS
jgi:hypothetical protein